MYEFSIEQGSTFDLELSKKQYLAAINLLKAYLKEDETFKEQADTHISICNSHIEDLPKLNKRYNDVWGIERSGFFNGREKWAKGFENQRV